MKKDGYCRSCGERIYWRGEVEGGSPWVHRQWTAVQYDHPAWPVGRTVTLTVTTFLIDSDVRNIIRNLDDIQDAIVEGSEPQAPSEHCKHGIPAERWCARGCNGDAACYASVPDSKSPCGQKVQHIVIDNGNTLMLCGTHYYQGGYDQREGLLN